MPIGKFASILAVAALLVVAIAPTQVRAQFAEVSWNDVTTNLDTGLTDMFPATFHLSVAVSGVQQQWNYVRFTLTHATTPTVVRELSVQCVDLSGDVCVVEIDVPFAGLLDGQSNTRGIDPVPQGTYDIIVSVFDEATSTTTPIAGHTGADLRLNSAEIVDDATFFTAPITAYRSSQRDFGVNVPTCTTCEYDIDTNLQMLVEISNATHTYALNYRTIWAGNVLKFRAEVQEYRMFRAPELVPPGTYNVTFYSFSSQSPSAARRKTVLNLDCGYDAPDSSLSPQVGLLRPNTGFGGNHAPIPLNVRLLERAMPDSIFVRLTHDESGVAYSRAIQHPTTYIINTMSISTQIPWVIGGDPFADGAPSAPRVPFGVYTAAVGYTTQHGEATAPRTIPNITLWPTAPIESYNLEYFEQAAVSVDDKFELDNAHATDTHIFLVSFTRIQVRSAANPTTVLAQITFDTPFVNPVASYVDHHIIVMDKVDYSSKTFYAKFNSSTNSLQEAINPQSLGPYNLWNNRLYAYMGAAIDLRVMRVGDNICSVANWGIDCFVHPPGTDIEWDTRPGSYSRNGWILQPPPNHVWPAAPIPAVIISHAPVIIEATSLGTDRFIYVTLDAPEAGITRFTCAVDITASSALPIDCASRTRWEFKSRIVRDDDRVLIGRYSIHPPTYVIDSYPLNLTISRAPVPVVTYDGLYDNTISFAYSPRNVDFAVHPNSRTRFVAAHNGETFEDRIGTPIFYRYSRGAFEPTSVTRVHPGDLRLVLFETTYFMSTSNGQGAVEMRMASYVTNIQSRPRRAHQGGTILYQPHSNSMGTHNTMPLSYAIFETPVDDSVALVITRLATNETLVVPMPDEIVVDTNVSAALARILGGSSGGGGGPLATGHPAHGLLLQTSLPNPNTPFITEQGVFSFELVYVSYFSNQTVRSVIARNITLTHAPECNDHGIYIADVCYCAPPFIGTTCALRQCDTPCPGHGDCDTATGEPCGVCDAGWNGTSCSDPICTTPCITNAHCVAPDLCECDAGWVGPGCEIRSCLAANGTVCPTNSVCESSGYCRCNTGYTGGFCRPVCSPTCGTHGTCTAPSTCTCSTGWSGFTCSTPVCSPSCGAHGECIAPNTCECDTGYSGAQCNVQDPACPGDCGDYGVCNAISGACECEAGWSGALCTTPLCPAGCGPGACVAPATCACQAPAYGPTCALRSCPSNCSGRGSCNNATGTCTCPLGWSGDACQTPVCQCGANGRCLNSTQPTMCTCTELPAYGPFCNMSMIDCTANVCTQPQTACTPTVHGVIRCQALTAVGSDEDEKMWMGLAIAALVIAVFAIAGVAYGCCARGNQYARTPANDDGNTLYAHSTPVRYYPN